MKNTKTVQARYGVGACVLATALVLGACGSEEETTDSSPFVGETETTTTAVSAPIPESERTPGAMVGVDQRTWPDTLEMFDDSAHATPGTWSTDWLFQRPVWTPVNFEGDLPAKNDLVSGGFEQCADPASITLDGTVTQQYVYARYLAVNDTAGPSKLVNGVPAGFAHSPQGAIMVAINAMGYAIGGQGDGVGEEIDAAWWTTYEPLQEDREFRGLNKPDYDHSAWRPQSLPAPGFYNVVSCNENVAVVEVGQDFSESGGEAIVARLQVFWREGDWVPDLTGQAGVRFDKDESFDPDNPGLLKEVSFG